MRDTPEKLFRTLAYNKATKRAAIMVFPTEEKAIREGASGYEITAYTRSDHVDALLKAEREKALREALDIIGMYDENSTCSECCDVTAINETVTALISKDETDG